MKRRQAIKSLGLSLGTITITPSILGLLQSCQNNPDWNPVFFEKKHINLISELSDLIIPSDDEVPGSKELNLIKFIDLYVFNVNSESDKILLAKSTNLFFKDCLKKSNKDDVANINQNDLKASLEYFFENKKMQKKWSSDFTKFKNGSKDLINDEVIEASSYNFLTTIRQLTITAFKGNELIGEKVLAYSPIPGQQKGCVDLQSTTGGKAWSL